MEKNEQMIMRDGEISTMMQQQEEDEAQKQTEKEQRAMTSTPTGKALILVQRFLCLHHFLQYFIPQNLGVASKVTNLVMDSVFFFDRLLHLQAVFIVAGKKSTVDVGQHYTNLSLLGMICTNRLMNPAERITNRATTYFSGIPTYYLRSLGCILYHRLFGSLLSNFYCQQINSLLFFIYHCFHFFEIFMLLI